MSAVDKPTPEMAQKWIGRCAKRITEIDSKASDLEAEALARAMWETPCSRRADPAAAAEALFLQYAIRGVGLDPH